VARVRRPHSAPTQMQEWRVVMGGAPDSPACPAPSGP
jgi:hypothetical protein